MHAHSIFLTTRKNFKQRLQSVTHTHQVSHTFIFQTWNFQAYLQQWESLDTPCIPPVSRQPSKKSGLAWSTMRPPLVKVVVPLGSYRKPLRTPSQPCLISGQCFLYRIPEYIPSSTASVYQHAPAQTVNTPGGRTQESLSDASGSYPAITHASPLPWFLQDPPPPQVSTLISLLSDSFPHGH